MRHNFLWPAARAASSGSKTAKESGGLEIADKMVDAVTDRFWLLSCYPYLRRSRDEDLPRIVVSYIGDWLLLSSRFGLSGRRLLLSLRWQLVRHGRLRRGGAAGLQDSVVDHRLA